jgi:hypothetical protein
MRRQRARPWLEAAQSRTSRLGERLIAEYQLRGGFAGWGPITANSYLIGLVGCCQAGQEGEGLAKVRVVHDSLGTQPHPATDKKAHSFTIIPTSGRGSVNDNDQVARGTGLCAGVSVPICVAAHSS